MQCAIFDDNAMRFSGMCNKLVRRVKRAVLLNVMINAINVLYYFAKRLQALRNVLEERCRFKLGKGVRTNQMTKGADAFA